MVSSLYTVKGYTQLGQVDLLTADLAQRKIRSTVNSKLIAELGGLGTADDRIRG